MVLGAWFWAYLFGRMVLGVWFWEDAFGCMALGVWFGLGYMAFGHIILAVWFWVYGLALGIWFWVYGYRRMVLGVWLWAYSLDVWFWGYSLGNEGRPSSKVYTHTKQKNQWSGTLLYIQIHAQLVPPFRHLIELPRWLPRLLHICIVHCLICQVDNTVPISHKRANIMLHCIATHENNGTQRIYLSHLLELDKMGGSLYTPGLQPSLTPSSRKQASPPSKTPNTTITHYSWDTSSRSL